MAGNVSGGPSSQLHLLQRSFGFKHRISFESSKGFKAGLENKDLFGRYKQAQEYLRKAKKTYQAILVSKCCIVFTVSDGTLSPAP